jgi:hypothetical protein
VKRRGPKPKYIDTKWTPELAYVVGIFASDGNLGRDGMYLEVTSKDKVLLENVLRILDMQHITIGQKQNGTGGTAYRIQFKRVLFHKWLCSLGLTPNKSLIMGALNIPDKYFFDFLRGEWDGDGTIYRTHDLRWPNSQIVSLGFASGSIDFLMWLQETINSRLHTTGHIRRGAHVVQLRYGRSDSKKIFDAMFYANTLPHLPRKFAKAKKIFKMTGLCKK